MVKILVLLLFNIFIHNLIGFYVSSAYLTKEIEFDINVNVNSNQTHNNGR